MSRLREGPLTNSMSDGPEDKTKLDPWWSVYCAEGRSGCDK
ncbi:MAG TPA: hypothetical protein VGT00_09160 [Methylomirabilota bacterium]|jgi:hypothetical protein|nr:hypothetical protein [Methylomirabilota bacterium]